MRPPVDTDPRNTVRPPTVGGEPCKKYDKTVLFRSIGPYQKNPIDDLYPKKIGMNPIDDLSKKIGMNPMDDLYPVPPTLAEQLEMVDEAGHGEVNVERKV